MKKTIDIFIPNAPEAVNHTAVLCIEIHHIPATQERRIGGKKTPEKFNLTTTLDGEAMSFTHTFASKEEWFKRREEMEAMAIKAAEQRLTELTTQSFEQQMEKFGYV